MCRFRGEEKRGSLEEKQLWERKTVKDPACLHNRVWRGSEGWGGVPA